MAPWPRCTKKTARAPQMTRPKAPAAAPKTKKGLKPPAPNHPPSTASTAPTQLQDEQPTAHIPGPTRPLPFSPHTPIAHIPGPTRPAPVSPYKRCALQSRHVLKNLSRKAPSHHRGGDQASCRDHIMHTEMPCMPCIPLRTIYSQLLTVRLPIDTSSRCSTLNCRISLQQAHTSCAPPVAPIHKHNPTTPQNQIHHLHQSAANADIQAKTGGAYGRSKQPP